MNQQQPFPEYRYELETEHGYRQVLQSAWTQDQSSSVGHQYVICDGSYVLYVFTYHMLLPHISSTQLITVAWFFFSIQMCWCNGDFPTDICLMTERLIKQDKLLWN